MKVSEYQPYKPFSYYSLSLPLGWRALWRCPEDVDSERGKPGNLKNVQKAGPRLIVYTKYLSCQQKADIEEGRRHGQTEKELVKEETGENRRALKGMAPCGAIAFIFHACWGKLLCCLPQWLAQKQRMCSSVESSLFDSLTILLRFDH